MVAGRRGNHNIAYFNENIKPLVLNATNSKVVKSFNNSSSFVEDWNNTVIELYIDDSVTMKGERTGGVRIRKVQPKLVKVKPKFTEDKIEATFKKGITIEQIKDVYTITEEVENLYLSYGAKE